MRAGIDAAKTRGDAAIILVGDEPYYVRVGFARLPPGRLKFPGPVDPARVLGLSLKQGTLVTLRGQIRPATTDNVGKL